MRNQTRKIRTNAALFVVTAWGFLAFGPLAATQLSSSGQANSPEEFDAYIVVVKSDSPQKIISAATDFEQHWTHSNLISHVFEMEAEAYCALGDSARCVEANEKALATAPDNLNVLVNLAYAIANSTAEPRELVRAENYAHRELDLSRTIHIPKTISPQQWEETRSRLNSTAHASLGLIDYKRGGIAAATQEFEAAVKLNPVPDPAQFYRLGLLYRVSGREAKAEQMFQRAVQSGDATIRRLAQAELESIGQHGTDSPR